mmetsp:Transcript_24426/g.56921  ORF Transcript_24426/g.56921 Transcript_24426/m.56921 type:complete len:121 (-) Transcript_24426:148-510(-)
MSEKKKLIVLISEGVSDRVQATNQSRALTMLNSKGVPFETIDGMDPNQRERRNELFGISGIRANYPQFFFQMEDGTTSFIGDWEKIEGINENSHLPDDILEANPTIETWDKVFSNVVASF